MFQQEKKYLSTGLNTDDAPFAVGESEYINAVNVRFGTTETGAIGFIESVPGTEAIPFLLPAGVNTTIGTAVDDNGGMIIYFNHNSAGNHGIYAYKPLTGQKLIVLLNSQVQGGLSFSTAHRINKAYIINGIVYFTDNYNEPRRFLIEAGVFLNQPLFPRPGLTSIFPYTYLTLIRPSANYSPIVRKLSSSTIPSLVSYTQNLIVNNAFQFAFRFTYVTDETSVLGPWSKLLAYGYKESTNNVIEILLPLGDVITEDVRIVELAVRFGNIGKGFVIKQWDIANQFDAVQIGEHNGGAQPLRYYFLNTETGPALDDVALNKEFDSIPLLALTEAVAKNRLFLGNGFYGYTAPQVTSLHLRNDDLVTETVRTGTWYYYIVSWITANGLPASTPAVIIDLGAGVAKRYVYAAEVQTYYATTDYGSGDNAGYVNPSYVLPASISAAQITVETASLDEIAVLVSRLNPLLTAGSVNSATHTLVPQTTSVAVSILSSQTRDDFKSFKSNSGYKAGIVFYDRFRRKCGVVTNDSLLIKVPQRTFNQLALSSTIRWTLTTDNTLGQIPDWAYYYSVVRTKNLTTDFFFQGHPSGMTYVLRDDDNKLSFNTFEYEPNAYGLGIKLSAMIGYGIGYTFAEGDLMNLILASDPTKVLELSVIGQYGDWVIVSLVNVGTTTNNAIFEIYTPHKESINEGYYEVGEIYNIISPGTESRTFSRLTGIFNGDVYGLGRTSTNTTVNPNTFFSYIAEAMSANDKYWKNWYTDAGWFSIVDKIGGQRRSTSISFSNVFIPGTRTNGLSSFEVLDIEDVPVENGPVQKLQLTSKTQEEGSVLLAISSFQTVSIYLGETQVLDNGGKIFTAISSKVIGTINVLKGSFGTQHPESVVEYKGNVCWFDVNSGSVVEYSANGLFAVSNFKMTKFFSRYAKRYTATGNTGYIVGGVDPYNNEYLLTLPSVEAPGYAGTLPTTSKSNEFDIYDGTKKTIAFKFGMQKFVSTYSFVPNQYEYMGMKLYSFIDGKMWEHNSAGAIENNFYGVQYTTKLMFVSNTLPNKVKVYSNIAVEGNMVPQYVVIYAEYPNVQITDLVPAEFINKEGIFYTDILRDRISPNADGTYDEKMIMGDKVRTATVKVMAEFNPTVSKLQLKFFNIGYHVAGGHTT